MKTARLRAGWFDQRARKRSTNGKHDPRVTTCRRSDLTAPLFRYARDSKGGFDGLRILKDHALTSFADRFRWDHVYRAVPAQPLHAPRPVFDGPHLQECREQFTRRPPRCNGQSLPRQFAPHVDAITLQEF